MAKKYTVSEEALRKLVKKMVSDELEKQKSQPNSPFIDEFQEEPWFYLGEPEPAEERSTQSRQQAPDGLPEWQDLFQQDFNELDNPPFLNRQPKKK